MREQKVESQAISLQVTESLKVTVLPNIEYDFLMTTREVSNGYDTSPYVVRKTMLRHENELIDGKHFVKGVSIMNTLNKRGGQNVHPFANIQPHQVFWTKRGIVRLGFFIKSERARLFRDWAEDLVINLGEAKQPLKSLPAKRKHNRLTPERLADILADVCLIEDKGVRVSLTNKLTGRA